MSIEWASWIRLSAIQKIALGLWIPNSGTVPITACIGHCRELWLTCWREEQHWDRDVVPPKTVKLIFGWPGAGIKQLWKQTSTWIHVEWTPLISNLLVQVCKAKATVYQSLTKSMPLFRSSELFRNVWAESDGEAIRWFILSIRLLKPKFPVTEN